MSIEPIKRMQASIAVWRTDWLLERCRDLIPNARLLFEGVLFAPDAKSMSLTLDITESEQAYLKLLLPELVWTETEEPNHD